MPKGKLFVIEGGDGAGKTTLIDGLMDKYSNAVRTREPGGSVEAENLRELLKANTLHPEAALLAFFAARMDHLHELVIPALCRGETVICDRFSLSTYAYQVHGVGGGLHGTFELLNGRVLQLVNPITIFLNIPVEAGVERIRARAAEFGEPLSGFDNVDHGERKRIAEGLIAGKRYFPQDFHIIDALQDPQKVLGETIAIIEDYLT